MNKEKINKEELKKAKAILNYVERWLDSNMDEAPPEGVQDDSANLKQKIMIARDPKTTIQEIELGAI